MDEAPRLRVTLRGSLGGAAQTFTLASPLDAPGAGKAGVLWSGDGGARLAWAPAALGLAGGRNQRYAWGRFLRDSELSYAAPEAEAARSTLTMTYELEIFGDDKITLVAKSSADVTFIFLKGAEGSNLTAFGGFPLAAANDYFVLDPEVTFAMDPAGFYNDTFGRQAATLEPLANDRSPTRFLLDRLAAPSLRVVSVGQLKQAQSARALPALTGNDTQASLVQYTVTAAGYACGVDAFWYRAGALGQGGRLPQISAARAAIFVTRLGPPGSEYYPTTVDDTYDFVRRRKTAFAVTRNDVTCGGRITGMTAPAADAEGADGGRLVTDGKQIIWYPPVAGLDRAVSNVTFAYKIGLKHYDTRGQRAWAESGWANVTVGFGPAGEPDDPDDPDDPRPGPGGLLARDDTVDKFEPTPDRPDLNIYSLRNDAAPAIRRTRIEMECNGRWVVLQSFVDPVRDFLRNTCDLQEKGTHAVNWFGEVIDFQGEPSSDGFFTRNSVFSLDAAENFAGTLKWRYRLTVDGATSVATVTIQVLPPSEDDEILSRQAAATPAPL
ncbi:MAG: hypothetical protein J3K34DRAFT_438507 [Monoraphidium minutum]|nr:MAG: hypothetical protein J3K34DRAFT_438507 [Monoraphidium minutum]